MSTFATNGYDQITQAYLKDRQRFKNHTYLHKLADVLPKDSTVLDIGCGAGVPVDEFLVKHGHLVWGFDVSPKQIELARKLVPRGAFEVKDMADLKFNEYSVDAVVAFYAIFHIPRAQHFSLLKKIRSYLQPGGWLLITMSAKAFEDDVTFHGARMHFSSYDAVTNKKMVQDAGFEIEVAEIDPTGGERHLVVLASAV
jgi:cyclopropane fatty-acyl-phospholipid synthase-like methyltransferase